MDSETLEIVAQDDGTIVVRKLNEESGEPVFTFMIDNNNSHFSEETKMQIAQAMATAGINKLAEIEYAAFFPLDEEEEASATWH